MVEPVGLTASILALIQGANVLINRVKRIFQAQEEFETLQEQLELFTFVIRAIPGELANSDPIGPVLSKANSTLERLNDIIKSKILRTKDGKERVLPSAWARHKTKIVKFYERLKDHRINLLTAINLSTLASNTRIDTTLALVSQEVGFIREKGLPNASHQVWMNESRLSSASRRASSELPTRILTSSSYQYFQSEQQRLVLLDRRRQIQQSKQSHEHGLFDRIIDSMGSPQPISCFERSPNYFPEMYSIEQRVPTPYIFVTGFIEEHSTIQSRTNLYTVLFLKSPRQWRRLTISLNITSYSRYWATTKLTRTKVNGKDVLLLVGSAAFPRPLLKLIQEFCCHKIDLVEDDGVLCLTLTDTDDIEERQSSNPMSVSFDQSCSLPRTIRIISTLDDMGCPIITENEVEQIVLLSFPNEFMSRIDGKFVYEIKFSRAIPNPQFLYNIQVLHCLGIDNVPGISRLAGVVTNASRSCLKSFLIELPKTKWSLLYDRFDDNVSWQRRANWAKQLVEIVCRVHSRGFVVGTFWHRQPTIFVDSQDHLHLWGFWEKMRASLSSACTYPPELLYLRDIPRSTSELDCPPVTAKTDIFHLGLVLWYLARCLPLSVIRSPICIMEGCTPLTSPSLCNDSHKNPIALPPLPESVPKYFRDMIDLCRAENPYERSTARELLQMFPTPEDSNLGSDNADQVVIRTTSGKSIWCSLCKAITLEHFFHCSVCDSGDFDLCFTCYEQGQHCYDEDHLLVEIKVDLNRAWPEIGMYHSKVKTSGTREVVDL